MLRLFSCLLFIMSLDCSSQIRNILPDGMSVAGVSVADEQYNTSFSNPATIGYSKRLALQFQYQNHYIIHELSTRSFSFVVPNKYLNTGLSFSYFGFSKYNELMIGLGTSRNFNNKFSIGLQANYLFIYSLATQSYHRKFIPQMGLSLHLSPSILLGFQTFNPSQFALKTDQTSIRIPSIFSIGLSCRLDEHFVWKMQLDKEMSTGYKLATGFAYSLSGWLQLQAGAYTNDYLVPCLGIAYQNNAMTIGLNTEIHPLLGLCPQLSVSYLFGKNHVK